MSITKYQKEEITELMNKGIGYREIANQLHLSEGAVRVWISRHQNFTKCLNCGKKFESVTGGREKKFCSDKCRYSWWAKHPEKNSNGKKHICEYCGREFISPRSNAKFCSTVCYGNARKKK